MYIKNDGKLIVVGFLSLDTPALSVDSDGEFQIPEYLIGRTGDIAPACNAEFDGDTPVPLYSFRDGTNGGEWPQEEVELKVSKRKHLYIVSLNDKGERVYFKVNAKGSAAMKVHQKFKKGDLVVAYGNIAGDDRTTSLDLKEVEKLVQ